MANEFYKNCFSWRQVGLIIGWLIFVPLSPIFVFAFFAFLLNLFEFEKNSFHTPVRRIIIIIISTVNNVLWIHGVTNYKPRCMLAGLIWCAFLAGHLNCVSSSGYLSFQDEKLIINSVCLLVFILALCCYDSISRMSLSRSRINQYGSNVTQVIQTRRSIVPTAPNDSLNLTCEVPIMDTGDTKSLIMMVD